ncbi:glycosyltransferase [Pseudenhygromyxa sp. WMMC2535]|uniref:glycosyltransferase family 2 protein n=1 Tax=Pseudenhygromyxa sp. WMMC2535 TaxID=2712867 RepID=UPI001558188D|nr:glycosyltransferase family 2 protein [Pseudenhygromyxa sp. WMMC2535]NVB41002.1 glycosyltransferase [Pseudenhygromyxa sp. WMMC2535]
MSLRSARVLVGVHASSGSSAANETLLALHEVTAAPFEATLLIDLPPDEGPALAGVAGPRRLAIAPPGGAPAAFNHLVTQPAEVYVFLEEGARPTPGWLTRLLRGLDEDPSNGLAGPSTNRCWNEQRAVSSRGAGAQELELQAESLARRFGDATRSMAPLHSLSDFCLAVRREVVAAIGAADTAYGRGPCWEMDYAARAARAGFRSVWVQAAFVHRSPPPASRLAAERGLFDTNKGLYQDRFCGKRATPAGREAPYHEHCRGEDCADFAPLASLRLRLPLPAPAKIETVRGEQPLVSCVMPTRGRPEFVTQSLVYFRRQDYPHRELIIVHEDDADLPAGIDGPRVRTLATDERSIGGKRNAGAELARGELIAHWDDDDWYGDQRLSRQAAPILSGAADMSGLNDMLFMVIRDAEFWSVTRALFRNLFLENVAGGTLMFRRELWERAGPYPSTSMREDAEFMAGAMSAGARLCRLGGRELCVYVRHGHNTWRFREGYYLQRSGWSRVAEPEFLARDRDFYLARATRAKAPKLRSAEPLVSCIMPTADRRSFVPRAIRQFLAQSHRERELLVIDDGRDCVADLIPKHEAIRYERLDHRLTLGEKRNIACELARGELIAHWDDDDWMAPQWLESQVATLREQGAELCGLDQLYFYSPGTRQAWRYVYRGLEPWVCGGTLCYTRELWQRIRFPRINVGEDNAFVWSRQPKRLAVNGRSDLYVAMVHSANTSPKVVDGRSWTSVPTAQVERLMLSPAVAATRARRVGP